jgi:hypothetical protein
MLTPSSHNVRARNLEPSNGVGLNAAAEVTAPLPPGTSSMKPAGWMGFLRLRDVVESRQPGSAGKITNCQIGVFAAYVSRHGKIASRPRKTRWASSTTRPALGTAGIATSRSSCSSSQWRPPFGTAQTPRRPKRNAQDGDTTRRR